jgi:hypothetical protein
MINAETNDTAAAAAEPGVQVAPKKTASKKAARQKKDAPKGRKAPRAAKSSKGAAKEKKPARSKNAPRSQSKGAKILEMIRRTKGATLAEIRAVSGWQAHSVRGFISTAGKKRRVKIESTKNEAGDRLYRTK